MKPIFYAPDFSAARVVEIEHRGNTQAEREAYQRDSIGYDRWEDAKGHLVRGFKHRIGELQSEIAWIERKMEEAQSLTAPEASEKEG